MVTPDTLQLNSTSLPSCPSHPSGIAAAAATAVPAPAAVVVVADQIVLEGLAGSQQLARGMIEQMPAIGTLVLWRSAPHTVCSA